MRKKYNKNKNHWLIHSSFDRSTANKHNVLDLQYIFWHFWFANPFIIINVCIYLYILFVVPCYDRRYRIFELRARSKVYNSASDANQFICHLSSEQKKHYTKATTKDPEYKSLNEDRKMIKTDRNKNGVKHALSLNNPNFIFHITKHVYIYVCM